VLSDSLCEHSVLSDSLCEHSVLSDSLCEHSVLSDSLCEHSVLSDSLCEHSVLSDSLASSFEHAERILALISSNTVCSGDAACLLLGRYRMFTYCLLF
jgi:hypothetical protein